MALVVCFPLRCGACCISHLARCISHLARCISHLARCISHLARCRSTRSRRLTRRGSARTRSTRCSRHPCHICAGTGLTPATSAPGLRPAPSRPPTRLQVLPTAEESARLCNHAGDDDMPDAEAFLLRLARMAPAKGRLQVRVSSAPSMAGTVRMTCSTLRTLHPCGQVMRLCCRFHVTLADVSSTLTGLSHACKEINTSKSLPLLMQVLASRAQVQGQMRQGRAQSRCRCGQGWVPCRCGWVPVPVQMWAGGEAGSYCVRASWHVLRCFFLGCVVWCMTSVVSVESPTRASRCRCNVGSQCCMQNIHYACMQHSTAASMQHE